MNYQTLSFAVDEKGIVALVLNRPEKKNALSGLMIEELTDFAVSAQDRRDWRAIVLSGSGDVFCAGGDLEWMRAQMQADRATRIVEARKLAMMLKRMNDLPQPLIGLIHGGAFGGGVGLASVCDHVLAAEGARFGLTETRLGLIPATIGPYVIARMGEGRARQVFMSAKMFDSEEALRLGLVARVVADDRLQNEGIEEARAYLSTAPGAVAAAKALARHLGGGVDDAMIDRSISALADIWESEEAREGIAAFLERRQARWMTGSGGGA